MERNNDGISTNIKDSQSSTDIRSDESSSELDSEKQKLVLQKLSEIDDENILCEPALTKDIETMPYLPSRGIINIGLPCFFATAIQVLFSIKEIVFYLEGSMPDERKQPITYALKQFVIYYKDSSTGLINPR